MGTWISHLRVAERVFPELDGVDEASFAFGSLAPDSGTPNEDWSAFDPPKATTHFLAPKGTDETAIEDMRFYEAYLRDEARLRERYGFALGYFFHLVCDNLWTRRIWAPTKRALDEWLEEEPQVAIRAIKRDWYGLDHLYLASNRDSLFHRVILPQPDPPLVLDFLSEAGLQQSLDHIRRTYSSAPAWELDRPYVYLNERTMRRFVEDASASVLHIHHALRQGATPTTESALSLLAQREVEPYEWPLGNEE